MGCWLGLRALKTLYLCKDFARNHKKNNAWNISRLINELIEPSTQQPSNPAYCLNTCGNYNNSLNSLSRPSNQQNVRCCLLIMKIKALVTLWYIPLRQSNASLYVFLNVHMYCNQSCIQHLYVETLHLRH